MKKLEIKISPKKVIIYSYFFSFLFALAAFAATASFLYNNFYKAITQSETLVILRQQIAVDTVNIKKFEEIIKKIKVKAERSKAANVSDDDKADDQ